MEADNITKAATFLLLAKFSLPKLLKHTVTYFSDSAFSYLHHGTNINRLFLAVTQKYELCISFNVLSSPFTMTAPAIQNLQSVTVSYLLTRKTLQAFPDLS